MTTRLEAFAPPYAGSPFIVLELAKPLDELRANKAIPINVSLLSGSVALTTGLVRPLRLLVMSPRAASTGRAPVIRFFHRTIPERFTITPSEGGDHLVVLSEVAHNLFWGSLVIPVTGEEL